MSIDFIDILKKTVATAAPAVATMLGGPMAGNAVAMLSKALFGHSDGTPEQVYEAAKNATPDQFIRIQELENEAQKLINEEVDSARRREVEVVKATGKRDWTMGYLVLFFTWILAGVVIFNKSIPDPLEKEVLTQVYSFLNIVVGFYFGRKWRKED